MCRRILLNNVTISAEVKFLLELIYPSARINKFMFAGIEGMTFRAYIYLNIVFNRLGNIFGTASTLDGCGFVIGMDALLHFNFPHFHIIKERNAPNISQMTVYHAFY